MLGIGLVLGLVRELFLELLRGLRFRDLRGLMPRHDDTNAYKLSDSPATPLPDHLLSRSTHVLPWWADVLCGTRTLRRGAFHLRLDYRPRAHPVERRSPLPSALIEFKA